MQVCKNEISLPKWSGGTQSRRHGGPFGGLSFPQTNLQAPQFDVLNTPCIDVAPPIEDFLATILVVLRIIVT